jgi:hypothetical protein
VQRLGETEQLGIAERAVPGGDVEEDRHATGGG